MEVKSKQREVIFFSFSLIMSCCSRCALQTSSNSLAWEMVRNAYPPPHSYTRILIFTRSPVIHKPSKGKHCYNTTQHGSKIQISKIAYRVKGTWVLTLSLPVAGYETLDKFSSIKCYNVFKAPDVVW